MEREQAGPIVGRMASPLDEDRSDARDPRPLDHPCSWCAEPAVAALWPEERPDLAAYLCPAHFRERFGRAW